MKKIIILGCMFASLPAFAQIQPAGGMVTPLAGPVNPTPTDPNSIKFDYDSAGNEIRRIMVYLSPGQGKQFSEDEIAEAQDKLLEAVPSGGISYYPNPVRSELYIKWTKSAEVLQHIYIIDMNGRSVDTISTVGSNENAVIDFVKYPVGIYNLQLQYSNGESKVLKVVKQ